MDDLTFLYEDGVEQGNARLNVLYIDAAFTSIKNLNLETIEERCPVLALSFEESRAGPCHYIEDVTPESLSALLRFAYGHHYIPSSYANYTFSLLYHLHVYVLAQNYAVPALMAQARYSINQDIETSCSSPAPCIDLVKAIRYIYSDKLNHSGSSRDLIDIITHYCVSCFLYHKLGENLGFRSAVYDLRAFHQDLLRTNMSRRFEDEGANAIVQLPGRPAPHFASQASRALGDFLAEMWNDPTEEEGNDEKMENDAATRHEDGVATTPAIPIRPRLYPAAEVRTDLPIGSHRHTTTPTSRHSPPPWPLSAASPVVELAEDFTEIKPARSVPLVGDTASRSTSVGEPWEYVIADRAEDQYRGLTRSSPLMISTTDDDDGFEMVELLDLIDEAFR